MADQYLFQANSNRQFFRVLQLDEQPPAIAARYPDNGNFAIRRSATLSVSLADQSGIDPASLPLSVGSLGAFTTNNALLTFTNNQVFFNPGGQTNLGAYGETVTVSLVAADILGQTATNTWVDVQNDWVKWNGGYRLPTEAEWEKAARGGLSGKRFPWGDTITHNQANYDSFSLYSYDVSTTRGYHPNYQSGDYPYTSPVGSFAPNGYGLYDTAGNVWGWCWDWYGSYSSSSQTDPRGPGSGSIRVNRGGSWYGNAYYCRVTVRNDDWPDNQGYYEGFRSVLPPGQ